ncbi:dihydrodipicolinate synthase family protein [Nitratireductor sp. OM-1]|uniref:dihydrodipicolinate synthase family protein n=1 Tax=Nitratireductor sp. OM-1 TaxID=1756988 RepID=UPI0013AFAB37|nr:dihydrodipicolinate synthase family protein [Nitratireductor sp. OM-1]
MKKLDFSGVFVVMLTPFDGGGRVDLDTVDALVDFYCDAGVDGIFPCGSAGEALHLDLSQKEALINRVASRAAGRTQVLPGAIAANSRDALAIARLARDAGCNGIVTPPPIYYRFEPAYLRQYFRDVIEGAGLPIVLYNIPAYAQPLTPELFGELAQYPAVAGLKDSSGSMVDYLHFLDRIRATGRQIGLMTGREELLYASLAVGGSGSMSAINAVVPEVMVRIRDLFRAGKLAEANTLQMSLMELIQALYAVQVPIAFREALAMRGFRMGRAVHDIPASEHAATDAKLARTREALDAALAAHKDTAA